MKKYRVTDGKSQNRSKYRYYANSRIRSIRALITCLTFVSCVSSVSATKATVKEVSKSYMCCGNPEIKVDDREDCEQTWDLEKKKIAEYHPDHHLKCVAPCSNVSLGKLSMERCLNVTLNMICMGSDGKVKWDKITNYTAQMDKCQVTPEAFVKSAESPRHRYFGLLAAPLLCFFALIYLGIHLFKRKQWEPR